MGSILILFGVYTIAVLLLEHGAIGDYENDFIYYNENGAHYVSPISSPGPNAIPSDLLSAWPLPATLLFIWAPLGFRGTCYYCLLYTSPSPRDGSISRMPSSA